MILSGKDPKSVAMMIISRKPEYENMKESNSDKIDDNAEMSGLSAAFSEFSSAMKDNKEIKAMEALKAFVEMCVARYSADDEEIEVEDD